jgi:hypothetical protein
MKYGEDHAAKSSTEVFPLIDGLKGLPCNVQAHDVEYKLSVKVQVCRE